MGRMISVGVMLAGVMMVVPAFAQTPEWIVRYNGTGNGTDVPRDVAVDGSGHVYVTGESDGGDSERDYATVKYDAMGNQLWAARYNGPGNAGDYAQAIAVDGAGNVYVTGYSAGRRTDDDYATIKYDPAGNELWAVRYNGPGNARDRALDISTDASGNVYVTGYSAGIDTGYDYTTIKYDTTGNELWKARYDGPENRDDTAVALVVDGSGQVYVTGASWGMGRDYATVKYSPAGKQLWVSRYSGPPNGGGHDSAYALALDGSGNVYVTGRSYVRSTASDYATIKYDPAGNELWVARYDGPASRTDVAFSLALDAWGGIYVTGMSMGIGTSYDYATIKYDKAGNQRWVARYDGGRGGDMARAVAVDRLGNVYIAGRTNVCYDWAGRQRWVDVYVGEALAIAVDRAGFAYVTGGSGTDYATAKYPGGGGCTGGEKLKTRCKDRRGSNLVKAKTLKGARGDRVWFCLDQQSCFFGYNDDGGKSMTIWRDVTPGEHTVTAEWGCGARKERVVGCPNP